MRWKKNKKEKKVGYTNIGKIPFNGINNYLW